MEMQQAWDDVKALLDKVQPHLLRAGIPERQLTMPDAEPAEIRIERYVEIYDWLHALTQSDEWTNLMKQWKLRPEHIWAGYELHEIKGLQEQILLEKAQILIRKRWKLNRPFFFGRKFKKGKPDGDGDSSSDSESETETATEQDSPSESSSGRGVRSAGAGSAQGHRGRGRDGVLHSPSAGNAGGGRKLPHAQEPGGERHRNPKRDQPPRTGASE
jgi:hypothetical protein